MNNFNKVLTIVLVFIAAMLFAQTTPQTLPAGFSATQSVSDPSLCKPITGALYTLCPVVGGTKDGPYIMAGNGPAKRFILEGDVVNVPNVFTSLNCSTSSQSNTGLVGSSCTFK